MPTSILFALVSFAVHAPAPVPQSSPSESASIQAPAPTAESHARWFEFLEPDASETAYRAVAWRTQFWPAVAEAKALGRPILFWAMNGHPLGCT